jgi:hypothetical protein
MKTLLGPFKGFNSSYLEQKQLWIDESYAVLKYTCASTIQTSPASVFKVPYLHLLALMIILGTALLGLPLAIRYRSFDYDMSFHTDKSFHGDESYRNHSVRSKAVRELKPVVCVSRLLVSAWVVAVRNLSNLGFFWLSCESEVKGSLLAFTVYPHHLTPNSLGKLACRSPASECRLVYSQLRVFYKGKLETYKI